MSRLIRHFDAFLVLLLLATHVCAQRDRDTYSVGPQALEVSGQVRFAETRESVANIPVRLERFSGGLVDQMTTDSHGKFRFTNLQRGYYKVIINASGFRPAQQDADLQVLFRAFLVFDLSRINSDSGSILLNDVVDVRVPAAARLEFDRGRAALADRNAEDAIVHFQRALELYPDFFQGFFLLATANMDKREWAKAQEALERALKLKPAEPASLIALGEVLWRQKHYAEAEKFLLEGLKLNDKSWHGHFTLGRLYWETGEIAKAGPPIGRTLQLKPDFAEAHLVAGNILLHFKQHERALIEYQEYLRLAPKGEFANEARDLAQRLTKAIAENNK